MSIQRIVNVLLTEFSADTVVAELVRCLALFPNLHTIQLFSDSWRVQKPVDVAFDGKLFPSVHTVNFNTLSSPILPSFPEARHVSFIGSTIFSTHATPMFLDRCLEKWPKLEVLRGFEDVDCRNFPLIQSQLGCFFI